MAPANIDEISEWYRRQMTEWTIIDENSLTNEEQNLKLQYLLLRRGDQAVIIFIMKDPHVPAGKVIIEIASESWEILKDCWLIMMRDGS